jgi:selenocysteine lyase/cysteine desulfurase
MTLLGRSELFYIFYPSISPNSLFMPLDAWFRGNYQVLVDSSRQAIANMVGANKNDIVLVENASGGCNAVMRSIKWNQGDKVLHTNIAYPMVTNTLNWLAQREGIQSMNMLLNFPASDAYLIAQTKQMLAAGGYKLCIFSHLTSTPAIVLPIKELTAVCHQVGALVLIDGAHALGQIPINVTDIGADFYVSNGHKWLYSPKGSAFMWVSPQDQAGLVPTVISSSGKTDYAGAFEYTGTRDYTAFASMSAAVQFRQQLGDQRITDYNHELAVWAAYTLAQMWGTEVLTNNNATMGAMATIRLPTNDMSAAQLLQSRLQQDYDTYIVVFPFQNRVWTRLSAQIYLEKADFVELANLVARLLGVQINRNVAI